MRRLVAFSIDVVLAWIAVRVAFYLLENITARNFWTPYLELIGLAAALAAFESRNDGVTPGRFLVGLKLVSLDNRALSIARLFERSCVLLLFPYVLAFLCELVFSWVLQQVQIVDLFGIGDGWAVFFILFGGILATSKGTQSLHDFIAGTAVSTASSTQLPIRSGLTQVWIWSVLSLVVVTSWYFIASLENKPLKKTLENHELSHAYQALYSSAELRALIVHHDEVESVLFDLETYYREGSLHFRKLKSAADLVRSLQLDEDPIFSNSATTTGKLASEYGALLTFRGILNSGFQERFAKTVCKAVTSRAPVEICAVHFDYAVNLLGSLHLTHSRLLLVTHIPRRENLEDQEIFVTATPVNANGYSWGFGKPESVAMHDFQNRNPAQK